MIWFDTLRVLAELGGRLRPSHRCCRLFVQPNCAGLKIEDETATAQRLGFVLEKLGAKKLTTVIHEWLPSPLVSVPFVPGLRGDAAEVKHWGILNNAQEIGR